MEWMESYREQLSKSISIQKELNHYYTAIIPRLLTAVNQIKASMTCAVMRNIVLRIICILTVPLLFGYKGIWIAGLVCEFLAFSVDLFFLNKNLPGFGYDEPLRIGSRA